MPQWNSKGDKTYLTTFLWAGVDVIVKEIGMTEWWLPLMPLGAGALFAVQVAPTREKRGGKEEIWRLDCGERDDFNDKFQTPCACEFVSWEAVPWRFSAQTEVQARLGIISIHKQLRGSKCHPNRSRC